MKGIQIHFLNVGVGDCVIVYFPPRVETNQEGVEHQLSERIMMIDLYHHEDDHDYENIIDYYKENFKGISGNPKPIFRFVCTHPHQDHICGLSKMFKESGIAISNIWDMEHLFEPENFDHHETHEDDWKAYKEMSDKKKEWPRTITTFRDETPREFWNEDRITILSPSSEMVKKVHENKQDGTKRKPHEIDIDYISYALMLSINNTKVIFGGDGKDDCWDDIFNNCSDLIKDCHILKAPHHGHKSAFHENAAKLMSPNYIIFSNSSEEDKNEGAEGEYKKAVPNTTIFKTCDSGTIIADCGFDGSIDLYDKYGNQLN